MGLPAASTPSQNRSMERSVVDRREKSWWGKIVVKGERKL